jgi:Cu/Ag efflux protein CusF
MKTTRTKAWLAASALILSATAMFRASADQAATAAKDQKDYTGTVVAVDPKEHALSVKNWTTFSKAFNLGDNCGYSQLDKNNTTVNDLRPGEKVTVSYQDAHGVLIASRVEQEPMQFEGMVKAIDADKHTMTLHRTGLDKELQLATECKVVLREGKTGTFADIKVGNHVTATYETPDNTPTARQIAQTSIAFTGTLTAIDLNDKTVKAKTLFASKKFSVADNCAIVINGKPDGQMADLKPNDKLTFSYDEINGINVVNRIAPAELQPDSVAATPPPMGY